MAQIDLSALGQATATAQGLSNLILVNPQKSVGIQAQLDANSTGTEPPKNFLFDVEDENTVSLESDITDHFVEDNTALQDQVALRPVTITTSGYIGELTDVIAGTPDIIRLAEEKLALLAPFLPGVSSTASRAANAAAQVYSTAKLATNAAVSAWDSINGTSQDVNGLAPGDVNEKIQTKQQVAFNRFFGYWNKRQLFTVQTPWAIFKDMAIKSLRAVQDKDTRMITNFEVTFKQMKFASSSATLAALARQGRLFAQSSPVIDHGSSVPVDAGSLSSRLA